MMPGHVASFRCKAKADGVMQGERVKQDKRQRKIAEKQAQGNAKAGKGVDSASAMVSLDVLHHKEPVLQLAFQAAACCNSPLCFPVCPAISC